MSSATRVLAWGNAADWMELTKLRLCFMALLMAAVGYVMGTQGDIDLGHISAALFGTLLVGASTGVLNQYIERNLDVKMHRTMNRPLPAGRVSPEIALTGGWIMAIFGELVLLFAVNAVTAVLGAITLLFYLAIYTPSKRITSLSTLIGAIPGAIPPLMGYTAARGQVTGEGLLLFGILFFWQIPHFLAIAWLYREDYERAGFPILTVVDAEAGAKTVLQVLMYALILVPVSLLPSIVGITGKTYFFGALFLGAGFAIFGALFAFHRSRSSARQLFLASIIYLPLLCGLLVWDKIA